MNADPRWMMVDFDHVTIPTVAFPDNSDEDQDRLANFLESEIPKWNLEVDLDRVIPLLENAEVAIRDEAGLKNNPPKIIITYTPAALNVTSKKPLSDLERAVVN